MRALKHFIRMVPIFIPLLLAAQPVWFGYFESNLDGFGMSNESFTTGYHKLRLDVEATPSPRVTIGANVNAQRYFGETAFNLADFVPANVFINSLGGVLDFPVTFSDSTYLDNLYVRIALGMVDITLGKQQLSFGPGYVWNPTDIFNFKQLLDPTYEQTGVNAIRLAWQAKNWLRFDVVTRPENSWQHSTKYLQLKTNAPFGDITLNAGDYPWSRTEIRPTQNLPVEPGAPPFAIYENTNQRTLVGGSFNGEIAGMGIWIEGAQNRFSVDSLNFYELSAGVDYTFASGLYLMGEGLVNSDGVTTIDSLDLSRFLQYFNGEIHSLYQHYLFLQAAYPLTNLLSGSAFGYVNLDDKSWIVSPTLSYSVSDNVVLEGMFSWMGGGNDTEFGVQQWQSRVRMKAYF
ncbi:MAG: hypothetical protein K9N11_03280 [Lentisphaeria bacterium]|nr:hypothetical protein [Candidatus Neomarinimicrobiota bacterium]MCF7841856.1 hypothetical protein [Lentisphaeria bacterium]